MENFEKGLKICENGVFDYTIVIPEKATYCINLLAENLKKDLAPFSADEIKVVKDNEDSDHNKTKEILLYKTNREESKKALCTLGYVDYTVREINGRIVIAAHSEAAACDAVERFLLYMNAFRPMALIGMPRATMPRGYSLDGNVKRFVS